VSLKSELELKIIEYESLLKSQERSRTILKEENESMGMQLNQIRPELDKLQIDCVVLGNQSKTYSHSRIFTMFID